MPLSLTFPRMLIAAAMPTWPTPTTVTLLLGVLAGSAMGLISLSLRVAMVFCEKRRKDVDQSGPEGAQRNVLNGGDTCHSRVYVRQLQGRCPCSQSSFPATSHHTPPTHSPQPRGSRSLPSLCPARGWTRQIPAAHPANSVPKAARWRLKFYQRCRALGIHLSAHRDSGTGLHEPAGPHGAGWDFPGSFPRTLEVPRGSGPRQAAGQPGAAAAPGRTEHGRGPTRRHSPAPATPNPNAWGPQPGCGHPHPQRKPPRTAARLRLLHASTAGHAVMLGPRPNPGGTKPPGGAVRGQLGVHSAPPVPKRGLLVRTGQREQRSSGEGSAVFGAGAMRALQRTGRGARATSAPQQTALGRGTGGRGEPRSAGLGQWALRNGRGGPGGGAGGGGGSTLNPRQGRSLKDVAAPPRPRSGAGTALLARPWSCVPAGCSAGSGDAAGGRGWPWDTGHRRHWAQVASAASLSQGTTGLLVPGVSKPQAWPESLQARLKYGKNKAFYLIFWGEVARVGDIFAVRGTWFLLSLISSLGLILVGFLVFRPIPAGGTERYLDRNKGCNVRQANKECNLSRATTTTTPLPSPSASARPTLYSLYFAISQ